MNHHSAPPAVPSTGTPGSLLLRIALLAVLAAAIAAAYQYREWLDPARLEILVREWGTAGMGLFVLLYAAATVLFLPGSVLTLAGGAMFGP
ncbi:MAG: hypothetical protein HQL63_15795, partial [Magnetococcales bacterium]|nr:hypothetical protein [Magnetococcales bacterium]